ncbi:MAG: inorganic diphosphatase [Candidatus Thermoplasmatota archaeon]|jgi:inorganic pyrophosphatase|nr:inorganic diphosphatase [Candidatus Thermoplasmatota archaeon]
MPKGSLWTDISYGDNVPDEFYAVIETPMGSRNKYEANKDGPGIILDRVLYSSVMYPANYGFIPQTYYDDGDPIDVLVLGTYPVFPGTIVLARPIGIMHMIDGGDKDNKIIAVAVKDPMNREITGLEQVNKHLLKEIQNFFETYKILEGKKTSVDGFGSVDEAKKEILDSINSYKDKFEPEF